MCRRFVHPPTQEEGIENLNIFQIIDWNNLILIASMNSKIVYPIYFNFPSNTFMNQQKPNRTVLYETEQGCRCRGWNELEYDSITKWNEDPFVRRINDCNDINKSDNNNNRFTTNSNGIKKTGGSRDIKGDLILWK